MIYAYRTADEETALRVNTYRAYTTAASTWVSLLVPRSSQPNGAEEAGGTCDPAGNTGESLAAMELRAKWMRELGVSEEEIAEYCQADKYPVRYEEELADLQALKRIRARRHNAM
ncbi:MAG: hypothetical protein WD278_01450 [Pirellulales bacterium]